MEIPLQLILTAFIVNFGLTFVQLHDQIAVQALTKKVNDETEVLGNFQNLFNSITRNNKKSETFHDVLKQEVVKDQQAFGAMKEELQIAQSRNAFKKRNFYKKTNTDGKFVPTKREIHVEEENKNNPHTGLSLESSELVYEHMHEMASADMGSILRPVNLTENRIKSTPEYKYRMAVILALQLYWSQADHTTLVNRDHNRIFVAKGQEILHLNDLLNETYDMVMEKTRPLKEIYVDIYEEEVIKWSEKMTKMPISQDVIDELEHRWKKIEELFEQHCKTHERPKDVMEFEIDSMRIGMKNAREEIVSQYEKMKRKMQKVLLLIEQRSVTISPDPVTEAEYRTLVKDVMGDKYSSIEDNTGELERCAKEAFKDLRKPDDDDR